MMKVLIVGLGSIANKHISAIKALNLKVEFFALRSDIQASDIDGITNIYSLKDIPIGINFAIISNPTNLHYDYIDKLTEYGMPLFIEKPPVNSLSKLQPLLAKIEKNNIYTYVACNLRYLPCIHYLKQYISTNNVRINEVNVYCGSYLPDWRPGKNYKTIYSANANMGGGVHLDLFHELDYIIWFFGKPMDYTASFRSVSSLNIDAIDYANYALSYPTFSANIVLNYYRRKPKRTLEIIFDNNTWTIDLLQNKIRDDNEIIIFASEDGIIETYKQQMSDFIINMKSNTSINTFEESVEVLKICLNNG